MQPFTPFFRALSVASLLLPLASPALSAERSGISLSQTRVIFNASDKAQSLTIRNRSDINYLIQSRAVLTPDGDSPAPFVITPPLFKLSADNEQSLRILPQGATLPTDKESLFYLAIKAIPASKQTSNDASKVLMGMRFNLKLFYRPDNLDALSGAQVCRLRFSQNAQRITVTNPTPYFVTLGHLSVNKANIDLQPPMLAPGFSHTFSFDAIAKQVQWQAINDYGGVFPSCQSTVSLSREQP